MSAAWRQFGGVANGRFAVLMDTFGSNDQIWQFHHHGCTCIGVVSERAQGFWSGARGGGEKSVHANGGDRVTRVVASQQCWFFDA